jgi:hypothetical protein
LFDPSSLLARVCDAVEGGMLTISKANSKTQLIGLGGEGVTITIALTMKFRPSAAITSFTTVAGK